jgi:hypothetical protein
VWACGKDCPAYERLSHVMSLNAEEREGPELVAAIAKLAEALAEAEDWATEFAEEMYLEVQQLSKN